MITLAKEYEALWDRHKEHLATVQFNYAIIEIALQQIFKKTWDVECLRGMVLDSINEMLDVACSERQQKIPSLTLIKDELVKISEGLTDDQ